MTDMFDKNTPYDTLKELVQFANQVDTHIIAHVKIKRLLQNSSIILNKK